MTDDEKLERAVKLRRKEIERGDVAWWFLSFGDGAGWLGACFVSAFGIIDAIEQSHLLDINPGGNVAAKRVSPEVDVPEAARKHLLSKDDLVRYFGDVKLEMRRGR